MATASSTHLKRPTRLWGALVTMRMLACERIMIDSREARAVKPAKVDLPTQIVLNSCGLLSIHPDRHNGQPAITTIRFSVNLDDDIVWIRGSNRNRLGQLDSIPRFIGCATAERCVWPMPVVPGFVMIKPTLQCTGADRQECHPQPDSQRRLGSWSWGQADDWVRRPEAAPWPSF